MIPSVLYEVNYSNDYNTVYNEAKKQIERMKSIFIQHTGFIGRYRRV